MFSTEFGVTTEAFMTSMKLKTGILHKVRYQFESLDSEIRCSTSVQAFKNKINERIRPEASFICDRYRHGMRRLTQMRVDFSDLRDHRFNHKFNCPSPTCSCGMEDETNTHFLLSCPRFSAHRQTYLSKISQIVNSDVSVLPKDHLTDLLLYGSNAYNSVINEVLLTETNLFIYKTLKLFLGWPYSTA